MKSDRIFSNSQIQESYNNDIRFSNKMISTNEINLAGVGKAVTSAGKSIVNGTKRVGTNIANTAKTVGRAIKKHPVRTGVGAAAVGGGYLGYKGTKKAIKAGKAAYQDWKV